MHRIYVAIAAVLLAAGVAAAALPALANPARPASAARPLLTESPAPSPTSHPGHRHPCAVHAKTTAGETIAQFNARTARTDFLDIVGPTEACDHGIVPDAFFAAINSWRPWAQRLPAGLTLFWKPELAYPH